MRHLLYCIFGPISPNPKIASQSSGSVKRVDAWKVIPPDTFCLVSLHMTGISHSHHVLHLLTEASVLNAVNIHNTEFRINVYSDCQIQCLETNDMNQLSWKEFNESRSRIPKVSNDSFELRNSLSQKDKLGIPAISLNQVSLCESW